MLKSDGTSQKMSSEKPSFNFDSEKNKNKFIKMKTETETEEGVGKYLNDRLMENHRNPCLI